MTILLTIVIVAVLCFVLHLVYKNYVIRKYRKLKVFLESKLEEFEHNLNKQKQINNRAREMLEELRNPAHLERLSEKDRLEHENYLIKLEEVQYNTEHIYSELKTEVAKLEVLYRDLKKGLQLLENAH